MFIKNVNFLTQFCLGNMSNEFGAIDSTEVFLKGIAYDFSVHYNCINKSDILNIHNYLMFKKNI